MILKINLENKKILLCHANFLAVQWRLIKIIFLCKMKFVTYTVPFLYKLNNLRNNTYKYGVYKIRNLYILNFLPCKKFCLWFSSCLLLYEKICNLICSTLSVFIESFFYTIYKFGICTAIIFCKSSVSYI